MLIRKLLIEFEFGDNGWGNLSTCLFCAESTSSIYLYSLLRIPQNENIRILLLNSQHSVRDSPERRYGLTIQKISDILLTE